MDRVRSAVDYELRLYVSYLNTLVYNEEKIADLEAEIHNVNYGLSSPRIKSAEEAKFQTSPKVYMSDLPLEIIDRVEKSRERLKIFVQSRDFKKRYCYYIAKKLCTLSSEELELIGYHYFDNYSFRTIAEMYLSNKTTIFEKMNAILDKLEKTDVSVDNL